MTDIATRRSSIKTRLLLAFGAIAGATVIASAAACLLLSQIGDLLVGVAQGNIPAMVASMELATQAQALAGTAPALMRADTPDVRAQQNEAMRTLQSDVVHRLQGLAALQGGPQAVAGLTRLETALADRLHALDAAVGTRLESAARRQALTASVEAAKGHVRALLTPSLEQIQSDITMVSMNVSSDPAASIKTLLKLVSLQVPLVQGFGDLMDRANIAATLLERASIASTAAEVDELEKEFAALKDEAEEKLDIVESLQPTQGLRAR